MAARLKFTKQRQSIFINKLRETANVTIAAQACGIAAKTAYRHRASNQDFAAEWDDTLEEALDYLEEEVRRRAVDGTERPVFYQGKQCGVIREYSDVLHVPTQGPPAREVPGSIKCGAYRQRRRSSQNRKERGKDGFEQAHP